MPNIVQNLKILQFEIVLQNCIWPRTDSQCHILAYPPNKFLVMRISLNTTELSQRTVHNDVEKKIY